MEQFDLLDAEESPEIESVEIEKQHLKTITTKTTADVTSSSIDKNQKIDLGGLNEVLYAPSKAVSDSMNKGPILQSKILKPGESPANPSNMGSSKMEIPFDTEYKPEGQSDTKYEVPNSVDKTPVLKPVKLYEVQKHTAEHKKSFERGSWGDFEPFSSSGINWTPKPSQKESEKNVQILWKLNNFQTMFNKITAKNITYCIDTSGSMYRYLKIVKDHVTEALFQQASEDKESFFNLVEFSTQVTQWSDKQVKCTSQTVAVAAEWINNLEATTGTNMLDALLSAFSDSSCQALCLITDGQPDQHPSEILDNVAYIAQNRPIHCYYMQMGEPDKASTEFLQDLAMETYGSFHIVHVSDSGHIERVVRVYGAETSAERIIRTTDGTVYPSAEKMCSVTTSLDQPPNVYFETPSLIVQEVDPWYPFLPYPYYSRWPHPFYRYYHYKYAVPYYERWSKWRPARAWSKFTQTLSDAAQVPPPVPGPGSSLIGTRVLARRNADGLFYVGSVKSQVRFCVNTV